MGEEKAKQLIVEPTPSEKEEGGYLEKLAKGVFAPQPLAPIASQANAKVKKEKVAEKNSAYVKLKKLESEHQTKIGILSKKINVLKEEQEKLKSAIDILKELNLNIPSEYSKKLNDYPEEMKNLEAELKIEKTFLDYLQNKVFPAIQEK